MNEKNTPKIQNTISKIALDYIPEAHCYLKINNLRIDLTFNSEDKNNIFDDLILEIEIISKDVSEFKIEYHKNYLKKWIKDNYINHSFEKIWEIREECIKKLS